MRGHTTAVSGAFPREGERALWDANEAIHFSDSYDKEGDFKKKAMVQVFFVGGFSSNFAKLFTSPLTSCKSHKH